MIETLDTVLKDKERRVEMKSKGLQHAAQFSWDRAARETLTVYQQLG
jgi:glycosyltransferase involved in cell wall biosynthesis